MLQKNSIINIIDNSTPVLGKCIHLYTKKNYATIGDIVLLTIRSSNKPKKQSKKIKYIERGSVLKGIIVHVKKELKRFDGSFISFSTNSCILINQQINCIGTRIIGPLSIELKKKTQFKKFLTMCPFVI